MEGIKLFHSVITLLSIMILAASVLPVKGQITTACTASMITTFTPCMNFITGSTGNGTSPTTDCCGSLKSLMETGMDCACLIVTGNVPFQLPINRSLALSLPRACKMSGVPVQCKASGAPLPAPGPGSFEAAPSPSAQSPSATSIRKTASPASAPETDTTLAPAPDSSDTPTAIPGSRPALTPSAASKLSHISSAPLIFVVGAMLLRF